MKCKILHDGKISEGDAMVNQASMTGESLPVHKAAGSYVYAGTVVEEGECVICVQKSSGSGRYDRIVHMIEESEKLKSEVESKASHLADQLVPYSLGGTLLTYLLTGNATRAISILMVDFSCALKLAMPISVLSSMREGRMHKIAVKGGRFLEAVAEADTIVFDKTGTLTRACPRVDKIISFERNEPDEMLRLAACLEEHYPHSIANAVVEEARARGLNHEERHSRVQYIVAHGISSIIDGEKAVIGSYHFVFQDEQCSIPEGDAGIAISSGAAIAREVAYITLTSEDLFSLITLRILSASLMNRIQNNYRFIMSFNTVLIALGVFGILPPATSALLHNISTIAVGTKSMTNLLD